MKLIDLVRKAQGMKLIDEDGEVSFLRLDPPLNEEEIETLRESLPCRLPEQVEELLRFSQGFENGPLESFTFAGLGPVFEMEGVFPHPIPIAQDGFGNYWILDLTSRSEGWGPIFFACHDPPVIVYQCADLGHFIEEALRLGNPPHESEIDFVHDEAAMRIWREKPGGLTIAQCLEAADDDLVQFARSLEPSFIVVDLRRARLGEGFAWGRFGPQTAIKRCGEKRIFAIQRKSFLERLFGR